MKRCFWHRALALLLIVSVALASIVAEAQVASKSPYSGFTSGVACSPNGALSNNGNSFVACTSGAWAVQPVTIGTASSAPATCNGAAEGMLYFDTGGTAVKVCTGSSWTALLSGAALGTQIPAAGSTGDVQFNTSGALAGSANLFWNNSSGYLGIGTAAPAASLDVYGGIDIDGTNGLSYPASDTNAPGGSIAIGVGALAYQPTMPVGATYTYLYGNTAVGYSALSSTGMTTAAIGNTALGYKALQNATSGNSNTAIGWTAMGSPYGSPLVSGNGNTAIGAASLNAVTSGSGNVGVGYQANGATTGSNDIAVGWNALYAVAGAQNNTALGGFALDNATSNGNIGVGTYVGHSITTGSYNTVLGGYVASITLNTGSNNILIGTDRTTDTPAQGTSNFLNIGNVIYATNLQNNNNTGGAANVGIGTTIPQSNFDVSGNAEIYNGAAIGWGAGVNGPGNGLTVANSVGIGTTNPMYSLDIYGGSAGIEYGLAIGYSYYGTAPPGGGLIVENPVGIGTTNPTYGLDVFNWSAGIDGGLALGYSNSGTEPPYAGLIVSGEVGIGTASPVNDLDVYGSMAIGSYAGANVAGDGDLIISGAVGIGTTSPSTFLHVYTTTAGAAVATFQNGTGTCTETPATSGTGLACSSDARLKTNISDAGDQLAWLDAFRVRDYTVRADGSHDTGVIAQEVLKTNPDMVRLGEDGFYQVYSPNPWKLVKAIQELQADNDNLRAQLKAANDNFKVQTDELRLEVDELRRQVHAR
jgi:hypothetical protein